MRAPEWVVRELEKIHKPARLGFWKRSENSDGAFFLLELLPARRAERCFQEFWNNRGPVFGSKFDPIAQVPIMVMEIPIGEAMHGSFFPRVRRALLPIRKRLEEKHREAEKKKREDIEELAGEVGSEMYWKAHRSTEGGVPNVPANDLTPQEKELLTGDWRAHIPERPAPVPSMLGY